MKILNKRKTNLLINKSELIENEIKFLCESIKKYNPKKILEVGVFLGGTSSLILESISEKSNLFSIDLSFDEKIGSYCRDKFPNKKNWRLFTGGYSFSFLEKIGDEIDFLFLDTDHVVPGEILDFLMIFPFLSENSIIVVHDLLLYYLRPQDEPMSFASRLLFSSLNGIKYYDSNGVWGSNIGLIKIKKGQQNVNSILALLSLPWNNLDIISKRKELISFFKRYYSDDFSKEFDYLCGYQLRRRLRMKKYVEN